MNIRYIKIQNFRSFDSTGITIGNFKKINLFIGANNSGKSNILKFLTLMASLNFRNSSSHGFPELLTLEDFRNFDFENDIFFSIGLLPSQEFIDSLSGLPSDNVHIEYKIKSNNAGFTLEKVGDFLDNIDENSTRFFLSRRGQSGGSFPDIIQDVYRHVKIPEEIKMPNVELVKEFRKISGDGIIRNRLESIVNISYKTQKAAQKKTLLTQYLKDVFGNHVDIAIPNPSEEIQLIVDGVYSPITSFGSGYQQVLYLALIIITSEAPILCIDEPELHLHPRAQRALLNLMSKVDKYFFISTHSSNFLDYSVPDKTVYKIELVGNASVCKEVHGLVEYSSVLEDLGIRPSEIYQSNGIIWVEGPSDRVYIKKWINLVNPNLKEGLQYTFQYYGGRVLSHYSIEDEFFEQYINLLLVNRNCYVIMDSDLDKKYSVTDLRETKQRLIQEAEQNDIPYWVTSGREIENYLTESSLSAYSKSEVKRDVFEKINAYCPGYHPKKKVQFAKDIIDFISPNDLENNLDLKEKIIELTNTIAKWNS